MKISNVLCLNVGILVAKLIAFCAQQALLIGSKGDSVVFSHFFYEAFNDIINKYKPAFDPPTIINIHSL